VWQFRYTTGVADPLPRCVTSLPFFRLSGGHSWWLFHTAACFACTWHDCSDDGVVFLHCSANPESMQGTRVDQTFNKVNPILAVKVPVDWPPGFNTLITWWCTIGMCPTSTCYKRLDGCIECVLSTTISPQSVWVAAHIGDTLWEVASNNARLMVAMGTLQPLNPPRVSINASTVAHKSFMFLAVQQVMFCHNVVSCPADMWLSSYHKHQFLLNCRAVSLLSTDSAT